MNCLEFRRGHDIDPSCRDGDFLAHLRECEGCAAFARRAAQFEQRLSTAMNIKTPPSLASKILVKRAFQKGRRIDQLRSAPWSRWLIAASIVLLLGVGGVAFDQLRAPSLGHAVIQVVTEAEHALVSTTPVALEDIRIALASVGVELYGEFAGVRQFVVTFASPCVVRGKLAGHIVVRGETAPISILLMPSETVSERVTLQRADLKAVLLPLRQGTIAILAAPQEELASIERKVLSLFRWQV